MYEQFFGLHGYESRVWGLSRARARDIKGRRGHTGTVIQIILKLSIRSVR